MGRGLYVRNLEGDFHLALNNRVIRRISIIGDGGWGTTLAIYLAARNTLSRFGGLSRKISLKAPNPAKIKSFCPALKSLHKYG